MFLNCSPPEEAPMTEPKPDDLIPMSDSEVAFSVKMGLAMGGRRGKMQKPEQGDDHWEVQADRVVNYFKRSRVLVFRKAPPDPPTAASEAHRGPPKPFKAP